MKEVTSSSTSLLGCGGANVNVMNSLGRAQVDGSHGPSSPHCDQTKDFGEASSWVLVCIIFFCNRTGLDMKAERSSCLLF